MNESEFADFYARYVVECIRRVVKPLATADAVALLANLGLLLDVVRGD